MKEQFKAALRELLKKLKDEKNPPVFYHDNDGEIDDDKYQDALEAQWDNDDKNIHERISNVKELLNCRDEMSGDDEDAWIRQAFEVLKSEGYKITISKTF